MFEALSFGDAGWGDELLYGLAVTIRLALTALPVGLAIGFVVAGLSMARSPLLRMLGVGYTTLIDRKSVV